MSGPLDVLRDARRQMIASLIAVKGHLDEPYPDDPRWTPWTRFVEPQMHRLDESVTAALAAVEQLPGALRDLESAVRILDVLLREPAAEGLMTADDYQAYLRGAWLGVDEAAEKARAVLARFQAGSPADTKERE